VVSVQDFGMGVADADRDKIFDLYYRGTGTDSKKSSGIGLGLYLSKQIVDLHKGKIYFDTEVGKGSTFYVELPKVNEE
jgi:signal transduction histidine kinase